MQPMISPHQKAPYKHHRVFSVVMQVEPKRGIVPLTEQLKKEYTRLYITQTLRPEKVEEIESVINKIIAGKPRYMAVSQKTLVPWFLIGIIHYLEGNCNFARHLHNGDPLTSRTVNAPAGRPVKGNPPFSWEESAIDSLHFQEWDSWRDWSIPGTLYKLELYNGFGSRRHGVATPYLWAGTTFYIKGKYVLDGKWNANKVSDQIGAATLLYQMSRRKLINFT